MRTGESAGPADAGGGVLGVFSSSRFWVATIVGQVAVTSLALLVDANGGFLDWMRPIVYWALAMSFIVATKSLLRARRLRRGDEE